MHAKRALLGYLPSMFSGSHVTIIGKKNKISVVMFSMIRNHQAPRKICDKGVLRSIPAITYTLKPTGGVIRPISTLFTAGMPTPQGYKTIKHTVGNIEDRGITQQQERER